MMHNLVLALQYDGTNYFGWQIQPKQVSVESTLRKALEKHITWEYKLTAAGRTDRGVHAAQQFVNIKTLKFWLPIDKFHKILNNDLPKDIRVLKAWKVHPKFNARFFPIEREYKYRIIDNEDIFLRQFTSYHPYKYDLELLNTAAKKFLGKKDFTTFSKLNKDTNSYVCDVRFSNWEDLGNGVFEYTIRADRFVYSMVRSIVGVMIDVLRGVRDIDKIEEDLEAKNRDFNSNLAPPKGLILNKVFYGEEYSFLNEYSISNFESPEPISGEEV